MAALVRGSTVAAACAVGLLAAACTSSTSDPPTTSPTPSPSVSSSSASPSRTQTPSATATGPEIPAAAREKTNAGAEAFVEYFFDQFNVAWTKPQPGLIKSLSDPKCTFCTKNESTAKFLADNKQRYVANPTSIERAEVFGGAREGEQFVEIQLIQNSAAIVDAAGMTVTTDPRGEGRFYMTLRWTDDHWVALEVEKTK